MIEHHIPNFLNNCTIYRQLIYTNRCDVSVLLLTTSRKVFQVQNKQILGECDLSQTMLRDLPIENANVHFDICFTYESNQRQIFFILQCESIIFILKKEGANLKIFEQCDNVRSYEIEQLEYGQIYLLCTTNTKSTIRLPISEQQQQSTASIQSDKYKLLHSFDEEIKQQINVAKSELYTIRSDILRHFTELADELKFGPNSIRGNCVEEKQMLAKFGDIWMRHCNGQFVFGIPVFNCTFRRKRTLENIRVTVTETTTTTTTSSPQLNHLNYTCKMFTFELDTNIMPNFERFLLNENEMDLPNGNNEIDKLNLFDMEWNQMQTNALLPETMAVVIVTMDPINFTQHFLYELHFMLLYDVRLAATGAAAAAADDGSNGDIYTMQNSAGIVTVRPDILYDAVHRPNFIQPNLFKDFLAIGATAKKLHLSLNGIDLNCFNTILKFLVEKMNFLEIDTTKATENDVKNQQMEIDDVFDIISSASASLDTVVWKLFYNKNRTSNWMDTLIKTQRIPSDEIYELKIYCRTDQNCQTFYQILQMEFGNQITINPIPNQTKDQLLIELEAAIDDETKFHTNSKYYTECSEANVAATALTGASTGVVQIDNAEKLITKRSKYELQTDCCYSKLKDHLKMEMKNE